MFSVFWETLLYHVYIITKRLKMHSGIPGYTIWFAASFLEELHTCSAEAQGVYSKKIQHQQSAFHSQSA